MAAYIHSIQPAHAQLSAQVYDRKNSFANLSSRFKPQTFLCHQYFTMAVLFSAHQSLDKNRFYSIIIICIIMC